MIPVLIFMAVAYWVAAPDRFTAGARTATGTATRAAGTGALTHWSSGRGDRQLSRTKRRDRWHRAGGVRRGVLRVEHGGVIFGSLVRGLSRMARAALAPVPAAVKDGWAAGQDRHRRRAGNRPAGVALDPPWWRSGTGRDRPTVQVQDRPGTTQGTPAGTGPGRPTGTAQDRPEDRSPGEFLDDEDTIRNRRTDTWNRMFPKPLTDADRRFWTERDHGYDGPLDQDGRPGDPDLWPFKDDPERADTDQPAENDERAAGMRGIELQDQKAGAILSAFDWDDDAAGDAVMARARDYEGLIPEVLLREAGRCPHQTAYGHKGVTSVEFCGRPSKPGNPYGECARHERHGIDEYGRDGYLAAARRIQDPPAGTSPAGTTPTTDGGTVTHAPGVNAELDDLTSVQDFAVHVADMAEESDFAALVEFCKHASDETRDFGADMGGDVAEFEETAAKIGDLLSELVDAATKVRDRSAELIGG